MTLQCLKVTVCQRPTFVASILILPALQLGFCPHRPPDPALLQVISVFLAAKARVPLRLGLCTPLPLVSVWSAVTTIHASPFSPPDSSNTLQVPAPSLSPVPMGLGELAPLLLSCHLFLGNLEVCAPRTRPGLYLVTSIQRMLRWPATLHL